MFHSKNNLKQLFLNSHIRFILLVLFENLPQVSNLIYVQSLCNVCDEQFVNLI